MRLVLLGPPGAGKGTQAAAVRERLGIPHISTGEMLRGAIAAGTPLGRKAKQIVDGGNLVPDDVITEMVRERLGAEDTQRGFLLDGYPRNLGQAKSLDVILGGMGRKLDLVLCLKLSDAEVVTRLSGRRTCDGCGAPFHVVGAPPKNEGICDSCGGTLSQRADDREDVIVRRLAVYQAQTAPLVEYYRQRGILAEIEATGGILEIQERLFASLAAAK